MIVKPLTREALPLMFAIITKSYESLKELMPVMPSVEERRADLLEAMEDLVLHHPSAGLFDEDRLVAFMTGYSGIMGMKGSQKGVYTPEWAHGIWLTSESAADQEKDIQTSYSKMFEVLWPQWRAMDIHNHALTCLSHEKLQQAYFFDMAYGKIVEDAVCDLRHWSPDGHSRSNLNIRKAEKKDLEQLWRWETDLIQHLNQAPIFRYGQMPTLEEVAPQYKEAFLGRQVMTLVAENDETLVGAIRGKIGETTNSEWIRDRKNMAIDFAWTVQEMRAAGIGSRLVEAMKAAAKKERLFSSSVDYETHNTEAKVFWRKHFDVFAVSMIRKIDDRL